MKRQPNRRAAITGIVAAHITVITAGCAILAGPALVTPQPDTTAGAGAAATRLLGDYAASRFGAAWDMLAPGVQRTVPKATWTGFYQACPSVATRYRLEQAQLAGGGTALVTMDVAVATKANPQPAAYPVIMTFAYVDGEWRYEPASLAAWKHRTLAGDLAAARASKVC